MTERFWGAAILAVILWLMFAIPYAFVFLVPQPLQIAVFFAIGISAIVFTLDWLVDRRRNR